MLIGNVFINKISNIMLILSTMFFLSCGNNHEPISTIIHLKNVDNIKFSLMRDECIVEKTLTDKNEISRFLAYFEPSKKVYETPPIEKFSKNGELVISFANDKVPLVIDLGMYEYSVVIKSKRYYERYTYQVNRYILEFLFD